MKCTVAKPFEHAGRITAPGQKLDLPAKQAESLRLQGKVKFEKPKPLKGGKTVKEKKP